MRLLNIFSILLFITFKAFSSTIPVNLRCDFRADPIGIDVSQPVLSWTIKTDAGERAVRQTAYEVMVATSRELLSAGKGDLWHPGKVLSDKMGQIVYTGKALQSSQQCWWKVRIWNEKGVVSDWSEPAQWTMGVLSATDWKARWISATGAEKYAHNFSTSRTDFSGSRHLPETWAFMPRPEDANYSSMLLRKEFISAPKLKRALVHVSGLGHYELLINGRKVGDYILSPGWTDYRKTVLYDSYDVTSYIQEGGNAIGLILSNGMYNIMPDSVRYVKFLNSYGQLKAIAQMRLEYADGSVKTIGTDSSWQVSTGPVTYMNQYGGEDFDARLLPGGWDSPSFKAGKRWVQAIECSGGQLKGLSCAGAPVKVTDTLQPVKVARLRPGLLVYDLGQNVSIMPMLTIKGTRGSYVRIIPSELIASDGTVDRRSATQDGVRPAWWQYTKASDQPESWQPQFFYQGGRYLQVELYPAQGDTALPVVEKLNGAVVHASATPIGSFVCSNELFNRIYTLVRWAQCSNMMSVFTDCPHREKMPWLEQYHLNGPSLRYNFDLLTLFAKGENDMYDSQLDDGFVPNIAPEFFYAGNADYMRNGFRNSPEWGSSFIIVPWQQYLFSGDVSLIRRYYEPMKRYLSFLDSSAKNNILNIGLGDWYDIGPREPWGSQLTPVAFTATAIYFYDYKIMGRMAEILGKTSEAIRFSQKAEAIRQLFNKEFYNPATGRYSTGSNTTMAMPLSLNIAEPRYRKSIIDTLVADIRKRGNSFTSGDVGYRFLLKALAMEGYSDVIFDMNNQSERPGYGYQLKQGATSLTEKWDAGVGSFGSQNHFMLGQINEWFFNDLAGIGFDEEGNGAGFRKSVIKPVPVGDLSWVRGSYETVSGLISSEWKRKNDVFTLHVTIPANTTATVYIPAAREKGVRESGKPAEKAAGVRFLKMVNGKAVYEVGSGSYTFESSLK
ncbi:family 78 glycoside hydrolase catalytic domain [Chitinophaga tropicalis]|uniref:alpha-L-rhamnosidase n=1 Tax=Chitinophaga tropicalis TaxID=2683588 RepID=A0A7K1U8G8_9BACT|nr:family 78 glycoside hydrolase catalytic domain [Chitinophaga tropicalis]MVT10662.1 family 78 glycoside hydrolase catalytic domain [Chitinophaga tropicalis]